MFYRSTPDNFLTFLLLLVLHLAVSSCLFLFVQHGLSLGRNIISFHLLNKRGQVRRKLNAWEVILDREKLAVIHTVEHPLGLDVIPEGFQNLRESLNTDTESLSGLHLQTLTQFKVLRHNTNCKKKIKIKTIGQKEFKIRHLK